jgi:hypothetical protein
MDGCLELTLIFRCLCHIDLVFPKKNIDLVFDFVIKRYTKFIFLDLFTFCSSVTMQLESEDDYASYK